VNGPGIGQFVHVIAPSGAYLDARVKESTPPSLMLLLEGQGQDAEPVLADTVVSLEFTDRRGVCRMPATARHAGLSGLRVSVTGKIELVQRRDYVRVEAFVPVSYEPVGPDGPTITANTLDVSGGGFQIANADGLRPRDMLQFTLDLGEGEEPVQAVATAVREAGQGAFGMRFVEILEVDRQRLIRWVFARERLARQIARHP
jgi:c-di-GMP-binding flagellar brake protein YcgR